MYANEATKKKAYFAGACFFGVITQKILKYES